MRRLRLLSLVLVLIPLSVSVPASARDVVNLLENGGFESGMPEPWRSYHTGDYQVRRDPQGAHSGDFYAEFAWRKHPPGAYSSLCNYGPDQNGIKVHQDVQYELTVYARGRGAFNLWIAMYTPSDRAIGTDFGETYRLTDGWKRYRRLWKPPAGAGRIRVFLRAHQNAVISFDDVFFGYDRDRFTPPGADTLTVTPKVEAQDAECRLFFNGKPFDAPLKMTYGEAVIGVEARAVGKAPMHVVAEALPKV